MWRLVVKIFFVKTTVSIRQGHNNHMCNKLALELFCSRIFFKNDACPASRFVREIVLEQTTTYKQNREPSGIKENKERRQ